MYDSESTTTSSQKYANNHGESGSADKSDDAAWPKVETYMRKYDDDIMDYYSKDIDTLLVLVRHGYFDKISHSQMLGWTVFCSCDCLCPASVYLVTRRLYADLRDVARKHIWATQKLPVQSTILEQHLLPTYFRTISATAIRSLG